MDRLGVGQNSELLKAAAAQDPTADQMEMIPDGYLHVIGDKLLTCACWHGSKRHVFATEWNPPRNLHIIGHDMQVDELLHAMGLKTCAKYVGEAVVGAGEGEADDDYDDDDDDDDDDEKEEEEEEGGEKEEEEEEEKVKGEGGHKEEEGKKVMGEAKSGPLSYDQLTLLQKKVKQVCLLMVTCSTPNTGAVLHLSSPISGQAGLSQARFAAEIPKS
jgi:hypothetical protein